MVREIPVIIGQEYEMEVERLGLHGEGVGYIDGLTVFVPYGLPGERVRLRIGTVKKSYAAGTLLALLRESPDRTAPRCPVYTRCGGCQLQHLTYPAQLAYKRQQVVDAIERIGGLKGVPVHPVKGAASPWHYRNKMQLPVGRVGGAIAVGCFAQGSHQIVDTEECFIQQAANNDLIGAMREAVAKFRLPVYDEARHTGVLRHIMGRVGKDGELMAVLITAVPDLPQADALADFLRQRLPRLVSLQQNVQGQRSNIILGAHMKRLWGQPTIRDQIGPLHFHISVRSFFQVNTPQAEVLYRQVLRYAALQGQETVLDVYCGTGTITLFLARHAQRAIGIEIVPAAIRDARKNAADNGIKNAEFIAGDATKEMPRLYKEGLRPAVIIVDPPRAGCTAVVLEAIAAMKAERIVYVSCNPASLGRDLAILQGLGYEAKEAQPVDMFSMTAHVETVVWLSRKDT